MRGTPCKSPQTLFQFVVLIASNCSTVRVPFASPKHASIAKQVIEVDRELQPQAVKRTLAVEGDVLVACVYTLSVNLSERD